MPSSGKLEFIYPDWPLAGRVGALVTTRGGGVSRAPWDSLNLGVNTKDTPDSVDHNRSLLQGELGPEVSVQWLWQVHGTGLVEARVTGQELPLADACYSDLPGRACAVLTADCMPVFFADEDAAEVAVAHAGWRGLSAGILGTTLDRFRVPPSSVHAWLGPAIGPRVYEVGEDVKQAFENSPAFANLPVAAAFGYQSPGKWLADLYQLARLQLSALGLGSIQGGEYCTYTQQDLFYSFRRDGETGRFASLIWLKN